MGRAPSATYAYALFSPPPRSRTIVPTKPPTIDARIEALAEPLPESERKLAELLSAQPALLATHSATELATLAASSKAAVTRFIQRLGYDSFAQARREAREAQRWGAPGFQADADAPVEEVFGVHLRRDIENLTETFSRLAVGVAKPAVAKLAEARRVAVVGFRNSQPLAQYFGRQLVLLRDNVMVLPQPGQTLGEDLAHLGPEDLLVILALRRRVPALSRAAALARKAGVPVLAFTDCGAEDGALPATWRIQCEVRGASRFDSYVGPISVLNLLVSALSRHPSIDASARLRQIERWHEGLDEL